MDWENRQLVPELQIEPESCVGRRRHQYAVTGIAQNPEQGLEHATGSGQDGQLVGGHRSAHEVGGEESGQGGPETFAADHGVIAQRRRRNVAESVDPGLEEIPDQPVLRDAQSEVAIRVVGGVPRISRPGEVLSQVLRHGWGGVERRGSAGQLRID
jgi:hypothetical protein